MLEMLSEKQLKLAKEESPNPEAQKQIKKEWDIIQNELNDLREHNAKLRKPMQLDDDPVYEDNICLLYTSPSPRDRG